MSRSKPLTLARLNDAILGAWSSVPPSETLDHLLRYLSTWSGTELRILYSCNSHLVQSVCKILVHLLQLRARLQHRAGLRKAPVSTSAGGFSKFAGAVADSQMLGRFWGLFQIFQWLISLERTQQPTRNLLTIERLQGWSMLGYYPFEHLCYLRIHDVIPPTVPSPTSLLNPVAKPIKLDPTTLSLWSCRCWASYVILQFAHLREDHKLLQLQQRTLRKGKGGSLSASEKQDLKRRWDAYWSGLLVNICNLPLALHWSVEGGLIKNPVLVDILSLIAAGASFRSGWNATALPSSTPKEISDIVAPPIEMGEVAAASA
ncbi:TPR-REGION domain-containing protein [Mycena venus]|uniref:TPR-REGION domain-containing protein n=1 Tax=Mycena venus TaxID=2733690 RepID=A0A8H6WXJ4_9AGAR|nr:TPR-REGION domain-containing protein [Mycena venus]